MERDTLNAVASQPNDDPVHAGLIVVGLRHSGQSVRYNALKRAAPVLLQMAQDPNETPGLRALAEIRIGPSQ